MLQLKNNHLGNIYNQRQKPRDRLTEKENQEEGEETVWSHFMDKESLCRPTFTSPSVWLQVSASLVVCPRVQ